MNIRTGLLGGDPTHTALIVGGNRHPISYAELSANADRCATTLRDNGLQPGDLVALQAGNNAQFVVALLAAIRAGLVIAPLDPALPAAERRRRLDELGARATLVDIERGGSETDCPDWSVSIDTDGAPDGIRISGPARAGHRIAGLTSDDMLVMSTSGTSGIPKLVPWTDQALTASMTGIAHGYHLSRSDATVAAMPLFHGHGLVAVLLATLATGGTVLLPAGERFSAHTFVDDLTAATATWYTAVPTMHQIMLSRLGVGGADQGRNLPSLRFIRSCSAALNPVVAGELEKVFNTVVLAAYGMTETTHQASSVRPGADTDTRLHTVGTPTGLDIRLSEIGEIWVRGATVTRGYLDITPHTDAFVDGWFRTGDLGRFDAGGHLSVTGRIKNLINRGGEKISAEHVEEVLLRHPGVARAAVVGIPDALYGERVAADIVTVPGHPLDTGDITEFCRTALASFEIPEFVIFTADLPTTAKGDTDRTALRTRIEQACSHLRDPAPNT